MAKFNKRYVPIADKIKIDPQDFEHRLYDKIPQALSDDAIENARRINEVMLDYYQRLGSNKATAEDRLNATLVLQFLKQKPISHIASNYDYYMGQYGGVDNSKGFWQAFGNKFKQFGTQREISNLQNRFDGTKSEEERTELLKKIEEKEKMAISLEDPNDRNFFANAFVDFAPILAQAVETGLVTGATALVLAPFAPAVVSALPFLNTTANVIKGAAAISNFMSIFALERGATSRELYQMAVAEGIELDEDLRNNTADLVGGVNALIELVTLDPVIDYLGFPRKQTKKIMRDSLADIGKNILRDKALSAFAEGGEEGGQQLVTYWATDILKRRHNSMKDDDKDFEVAELSDRILESLSGAGEAFVSVLAPSFIGGGFFSTVKELGKYGGRQTFSMLNHKSMQSSAKKEGFEVKDKTPIETNVINTPYKFQQAKKHVEDEAIQNEAQKEKEKKTTISEPEASVESGLSFEEMVEQADVTSDKQAKATVEEESKAKKEEKKSNKKKELRNVRIVVADDETIEVADFESALELERARRDGDKYVNFINVTEEENKKRGTAEDAVDAGFEDVRDTDLVMAETVDLAIYDNRGELKDGNVIEFSTVEDKMNFIEELKGSFIAHSDTMVSIRLDDNLVHNYKLDVKNSKLDLNTVQLTDDEKGQVDFVVEKLGDKFSRSHDENVAIGMFVLRAVKPHGMTTQQFFENYISDIQYDDDLIAQGSVRFGEDMKALITAGHNATPETFEHEIMHVIANIGDHKSEFTKLIRKIRYDKEFQAFIRKSRIIKTYNPNTLIKEGFANEHEWTVADEEFFTELYKEYRAEADQKDKAVKNFFDKITGWFKSIYQGLKNTIQLNSEIVDYFDKLFSDTEQFKNITPMRRAKPLTLYELDEQDKNRAKVKERKTVVEEVKRNLSKSGKFNDMPVESVESLIKNRVYVPPRVLLEHITSKVVQRELQERFWIKNILKAHPEYKAMAKKSKSVDEFIEKTGQDNANTIELLKRYYAYSKVRTPLQILYDFEEQFINTNSGILELYKILTNNVSVRKKQDGSLVRVRYDVVSKVVREFPHLDAKSSNADYVRAQEYLFANEKAVLQAFLRAKMNLQRLDFLDGEDAGFLQTASELAYMSIADEDFDELKEFRDSNLNEMADSNAISEINELRKNLEAHLSEQDRAKLKEEMDIERAVYYQQLVANVISAIEEYKAIATEAFEEREEALKFLHNEMLQDVIAENEAKLEEVKSDCEQLLNEYYDERDSLKKELKDTKKELSEEKKKSKAVQDKYDKAMFYNRTLRDEQHRNRVQELKDQIEKIKAENKEKIKEEKEKNKAKIDKLTEEHKEEVKKLKDAKKLANAKIKTLEKEKEEQKTEFENEKAEIVKRAKNKEKWLKERHKDKVKTIRNTYRKRAIDRRIKSKLKMNNRTYHISLLETLTYIRDLVNDAQLKYYKDGKDGKMTDKEYATVKLLRGTDDGEILDVNYELFANEEQGTTFEVEAELHTGEIQFDIAKIPPQLRRFINDKTYKYLKEEAKSTKWVFAPDEVREDILYSLIEAKREAKEAMDKIKKERRDRESADIENIVKEIFDSDTDSIEWAKKKEEIKLSWQQYHFTVEEPTDAQLVSYYVQNYKRFNDIKDLSIAKRIHGAIGGAIGHIQGICMLLGGGKDSAVYKAFVIDTQRGIDNFYRNKQRRLKEADELLRQYTAPKSETLEWLKGQHTVEVNHNSQSSREKNLSGFQLLGAYIYSKNVFGFIKLFSSKGNNFTLETMASINPEMTRKFIEVVLSDYDFSRLSRQYKDLKGTPLSSLNNFRYLFKDYTPEELRDLLERMDVGSIEKIVPDWCETMGDEMINLLEKETPRISEFAVKVLNQSFLVQANYFPLINAHGGNTDVAIGQMLSNSNKIYTGMIKSRILTDDYELLLDPIATLYSAIDSQERLINLSQDVYRLDRLLDSKGGNLYHIVEEKFGRPYAEAMLAHVKTLAGQNDVDRLTEFERWYNSLLGNSAVSVLAFNIMSSLKQFISLIFAATQGEIKFTDVLGAFKHIGVDDYIFEMNAPEIANSGFNYEIDKHIADKVKQYGYAQRKKIQEIGMAHIEKADMLTKKLVWFAKYDKALEAGEDEYTASVHATDLVKRTMSVSNPENLSQLQRKKNPFARAMFMFTTDLFQMWNAIWFGIPNDFKNGDKYKAIEKIVGLSCVVTALALSKGGWLPDDDEEGFIDYNQLLKDLFSEASQMIPGIGGAVQDAVDGWTGGAVTAIEKTVGLLKLPFRKTPATGYDYADRFLDLVISYAGALGAPSLAFNRGLKVVLPEGIKEDGFDLDVRNLGYVLNDNLGDFLNSL